MYAYTKKNKRARIYATCASGLFLVLMVGVLSMSEIGQNQKEKQDTKVVAKEVAVPVISLPKAIEKAIRPFQVQANIVLDFYDGTQGEVASYSLFEGVYRMNQGIDYAYQNQNFDVLAVYSGTVEEVKEDPMFGHSVKVKSENISITYQSLTVPSLKVGDAIKQGDVIGKASTNIYSKDLGNHLHMVVSKNNQLVDPESIYGLSIQELNK